MNTLATSLDNDDKEVILKLKYETDERPFSFHQYIDLNHIENELPNKS